MIVARWTYRSLGFDALKDFDAISNVVNVDAVLVANPAVPVKTVKDLIALAKAQPGKLNMASAGVGSSSHLAGVMLSNLAGINTVHVPYKGGGPMAQAVIAGEAAYAISPAAAVVGFIKSGRLRGVAISSKQRSPLLPELPTIDEAGVAGFEFSSWNGLFAPRGTPRPIINRIHRAPESDGGSGCQSRFGRAGPRACGEPQPGRVRGVLQGRLPPHRKARAGRGRQT